MASVIDNILSTCSKLGDVTLAGVKLESGDASLLDVTQYEIDQHVSMQPSAVAYFGALKREAVRNLATLKRAFDRWEKKKYAEARVAVLTGTTAPSALKVEDVKARFIIDNESELEKWDARLDRAQLEYDTLDAWFEAWKQKSFSIREYLNVESEERYNSSGAIGEQKPSRTMALRALLEERRKSKSV